MFLSALDPNLLSVLISPLDQQITFIRRNVLLTVCRRPKCFSALVVVGECGLTRADMLHNLLLHYHPNESNTVSVMVGWRKATKKNSLALCRG